jgi:hypothetical protein
MKLFAIQPLLIVVFGLMLFFANGNAANERVVDYEYDGAGNIVRIITQEQSDLPVISSLNPGFINQGQSRTITASGSNLLGVEVTTDAPGLSIDAFESNKTAISFQLTATSQALIGNAIIRFTTGLGEVQQSIFVAEVGPAITTSPSPITIDLSATSNTVTLNFSVPRPEGETFNLSVIDPATATVDSMSFDILAGATRADISLIGITTGATVLQIDLPAKFYSYRFPVYVSETYVELLASFPDMAQRNLFTEAVGVVVQSNNPYLPNTVTSGPVGVVVQSNNPYLPNTVTSGPVGVLFDSNAATFAKPVGVLYGDATNVGLSSKPVGVIVSSSISYAYNAPVGIIYGPYLMGSQPEVVVVDATTIVEVSGFNLVEVVTVNLAPADDIVVGSISTNTEGTLLTVSITVDPLATTGQRELILEDADGPISIGPGIPLTIDIQ